MPLVCIYSSSMLLGHLVIISTNRRRVQKFIFEYALLRLLALQTIHVTEAPLLKLPWSVAFQPTMVVIIILHHLFLALDASRVCFLVLPDRILAELSTLTH